ncbi:ribosomal protein S13 [Wallemia mellicola]|nr:ribosomal protein S13 [Wallemia mellicola]
MVYLLGVNLPDNKLVKIALTRFYGIGLPTSERICAYLSIHDKAKIGQLPEHQMTSLSSFLSAPPALPTTHYLHDFKIEADLRREVRSNIEHHRQIGSYKGRRHGQGLPVRGQNTHSNARTARRVNRLGGRGFATSARSSIQPFFKNFISRLIK